MDVRAMDKWRNEQWPRQAKGCFAAGGCCISDEMFLEVMLNWNFFFEFPHGLPHGLTNKT